MSSVADEVCTFVVTSELEVAGGGLSTNGPVFSGWSSGATAKHLAGTSWSHGGDAARTTWHTCAQNNTMSHTPVFRLVNSRPSRSR